MSVFMFGVYGKWFERHWSSMFGWMWFSPCLNLVHHSIFSL